MQQGGALPLEGVAQVGLEEREQDPERHRECRGQDETGPHEQRARGAAQRGRLTKRGTKRSLAASTGSGISTLSRAAAFRLASSR